MNSKISVSFAYLQIILATLSRLDFMGFVLLDIVGKTHVSKRVFSLATSFQKYPYKIVNKVKTKSV